MSYKQIIPAIPASYALFDNDGKPDFERVNLWALSQDGEVLGLFGLYNEEVNHCSNFLGFVESKDVGLKYIADGEIVLSPRKRHGSPPMLADSRPEITGPKGYDPTRKFSNPAHPKNRR